MEESRSRLGDGAVQAVSRMQSGTSSTNGTVILSLSGGGGCFAGGNLGAEFQQVLSALFRAAKVQAGFVRGEAMRDSFLFGANKIHPAVPPPNSGSDSDDYKRPTACRSGIAWENHLATASSAS
jgi:hypothetical protein